MNSVRPGGLDKFRATDREECGIIISNEDLLYIVKVPNVAANDGDYAITLESMQEVESNLDEGEKVAGFMHTHLPHQSCEPSTTDLNGARIFPGLRSLVYKPSTGELRWYAADGEVDTP